MTTQRIVIFLSCILFATAQAKAMGEQQVVQMVRASSPFSEISEQSAFFDALRDLPGDRDDLLEELPESTKLYYELFGNLGPQSLADIVGFFTGLETTQPAPVDQPAQPDLNSAWRMDIEAATTLFEAIDQSSMQTNIPVKAVRYLATRLRAMNDLATRMPDLARLELSVVNDKMLTYAQTIEHHPEASLKELAAFIRDQLNLQPQQ